jgi:hypothetical protein
MSNNKLKIQGSGIQGGRNLNKIIATSKKQRKGYESLDSSILSQGIPGMY